MSHQRARSHPAREVDFSKYHGLGNDFAIFYDPERDLALEPRVVQLCERHRGIGADGVIRVSRGNAENSLHYDHFNPDGSVATMCGNGLRCLAQFAWDTQLISGSSFLVETRAGTLEAVKLEDGLIRTSHGCPSFEPARIPVNCLPEEVLRIPIETPDWSGAVACVFPGTTHAVLFVEDLERVPVERIGRAISANERLPDGANVTFVQVLTRSRLAIRVWERGVNAETQACGTGTVAAGVVSRLLRDTEPVVSVTLPGGSLQVEWHGSANDPQPAFLTGSARHTFTGRIVL